MINQYVAVPQWLKDRNIWVCFKKEKREDGKWTKLPKSAHYNPDVRTSKGNIMGWNADTSKPKTWDSFNSCVNRVKTTPKHNDGVGLVLIPPLVGIDLDHVWDPEAKAWKCREAKEVYEHFKGKAYIEFSPSGDGIHIITKGILPEGIKHKIHLASGSVAFELYQTQWDGKSELTSGGRYLTITGKALEGSSLELIETQTELDWFCGEFMKDDQTRTQKKRATSSNSALNNVSDAELVSKLADNDIIFKKLYFEGSESFPDNQDLSSLDQMLFWRIALLTEDPEQIKRIAFNSALKRDKWVKRESDYLDKYSIPAALKKARLKPECRIKLKLAKNKKTGQVRNTYPNVLTILREDPRLPKIRKNLVSQLTIFEGDCPWSLGASQSKSWNSSCDAGLDEFINTYYGFDPSKDNRNRAIDLVSLENSFNPLQDILKKLPEWDGKDRVEFLFIDYIGAEDNPYTRAVAKYSLSAAYQRAFKAGLKWDCVPILIGGQGIGKSTLLAKLALRDDFFTDSLTLDKMGTDKGAQIISSAWIVELSELAGMNKSEAESVKQFVSSPSDKFRVPYERYAEEHPRQCVFFGTSNQRDGLLRDATGNRRFLPIYSEGEPLLKSWDLSPDEARQIWAEVKAKWAELPLKFPKEIEELALEAQGAAFMKDVDAEIVEAYLDMDVPLDWESMSINERIIYFSEYDHPYKVEERAKQSTKRIDKTCLREVWSCALGRLWQGRQSQNQALAVMAQVEGWKSSTEEYKGSVHELKRARAFIRVE